MSVYWVAGGLWVGALAGAEKEPGGDVGLLIESAAKVELGGTIESFRLLEERIRQSFTNVVLRVELEDGLVKLLSPEVSAEARRFACQQLAVIGSERCLGVLGDLLVDESASAWALQALSMNRSARAGALLRNSIAKAAVSCRPSIIGALGQRGDRAVVPVLRVLSRDSDAATAEAAIVALGQIADAAALDILVGLRKESARVETVLEATLTAAEKLVSAGEREVALSIYRELLEPSLPRNVRRGALQALLPLEPDGGERRIMELLKGDDALLKPVAIAAVPTLPGAGVSERFARELWSLPEGAQVWLLEALAARGDEGGRTAVLAQLNEEPTAVRVAAMQCASKWNDRATTAALIQVTPRSAEERIEWERALTSLRGGAEAERVMIEMFKTGSTEKKIQLMSVLARRGTRLAVPVLLQETGERSTARAAFRALAKLVEAEDLPALLEKLATLRVPQARGDAENAVLAGLNKVEEPSRRSELLLGFFRKAPEPEGRISLLTLLPQAGDAAAFEVVRKGCSDPDADIRDTAWRSLAEWPNLLAWDSLLEVYRKPATETYRVLALRGLTRLAQEENSRDPGENNLARYRQLIDGSRTASDRRLILGAMASATHPGMLDLIWPLLDEREVHAEAAVAVRTIAETIRARHPEMAKAALERLKF